MIGLANAYRSLGYEVVVGTENLFLETASFDLIHFMWPESFCPSRRPDDALLRRLSSHLTRWAARAKLIISVHNFYPHGFQGDSAYKRLYELFYDRCMGIHHFSEVSRDMVCREWPVAATKPNRVTLGYNYSHLCRHDVNRAALRGELGLREEEFAVLVFGALRNWDEVKLLRSAFSAAHVPGKRLMAISRLQERGTIRARLRRYRWEAWKRRSNAINVTAFIPDEDVYRYFDAADAVVVPRIDTLNSGIPSMAMTFGKLVIGPNHGSFPELASGTGNILYESGSVSSLARAIEQASRLDLTAIAEQNRLLAHECSWERIAQCCLGLAGYESSAGRASLSY